jgi:hypothetical protein
MIKEARFERVEYAALELIQLVEQYASAETFESKKWNRRKILEAARRYGRAIENLARNRE